MLHSLMQEAIKTVKSVLISKYRILYFLNKMCTIFAAPTQRSFYKPRGENICTMILIFIASIGSINFKLAMPVEFELALRTHNMQKTFLKLLIIAKNRQVEV